MDKKMTDQNPMPELTNLVNCVTSAEHEAPEMLEACLPKKTRTVPLTKVPLRLRGRISRKKQKKFGEKISLSDRRKILVSLRHFQHWEEAQITRQRHENSKTSFPGPRKVPLPLRVLVQLALYRIEWRRHRWSLCQRHCGELDRIQCLTDNGRVRFVQVRLEAQERDRRLARRGHCLLALMYVRFVGENLRLQSNFSGSISN